MSRVFRLITLAAFLASVTLATTPVSSVYAGGIIVNSLADSFTPGNSQCTLREAIINANTNIDSTRGDCAQGTYGNDLIAFTVHGTIILSETLPVMTDHITIIAPSNGVGITLNGNDRAGVFVINSNITVRDLQRRCRVQYECGEGISDNSRTVIRLPYKCRLTIRERVINANEMMFHHVYRVHLVT
jgi:CSLREA domain-containing protein